MSGSPLALEQDPAPIVACTISRDVQAFDLLIEDMEAEMGEAWGDLSLEDAFTFFEQPESADLEFVAIAMDEEDEPNLAKIAEVIRQATARNIKALVIAEEVSPIALHQLLKVGAEEFIPYPLPDGALHEAIVRLRTPEVVEPPPPPVVEAPRGPAVSETDREGVLIAVQGLAGGTGATTLAVNLAWELATIAKVDGPRVCLIDLDLQFGSVSTYLDLPRREMIYELLSDTSSMDDDSFMAGLLTFNERLHVFTSPADMLPLDIVSSEDIMAVIAKARANFDFVIVDMPTTVVQWTESVLTAAHVYFATIELDMRSAQNTLRMIRALKSEELPHEKLRYVLNRAPKFTDINGKGRVKRLADSLDIKIDVQLPDGLKPVVQAGDHGVPLAEAATKNPLRKEIQKLAQQLHAISAPEAAVAKKKKKAK
ncbi:AAA family ATPase [Maritimibacter sp. DP1N21-5]|uniref:AAA family ATPase n=1 Tax=Maritimibacter sp. DP1N21-5 TaxID=2836867 RepID=UPI001C4626BE|nr:AAA family ATPase [Maritimibacter sp. DP1N21-5]MBV7409245.1 AAA family ATPase [Maritimibacter sp. DP1N21-5]